MRIEEFLKEMEETATFKGHTMRMITQKITTIASILKLRKLDVYTLLTVLRMYLYTRDRKVNELSLLNKLKEIYRVDEDYLYYDGEFEDISTADRYALLYALLEMLSPEEIYTASDIQQLLKENWPDTILADMTLKRLTTALKDLSKVGAITLVIDEVSKGSGSSHFLHWCLNDLRGLLDSFWYSWLDGNVYYIKR